MPGEHAVRRDSPTGHSLKGPDRNPCICAGGNRPAIPEERDGVDRTVMEPQHLLGGTLPKIPQNGATIEAAGERRSAVVGNGEGADGTAMSAQLRSSRRSLQR